MSKDRLVFDCNVFAHALVNKQGPGGECVSIALQDRVELFLSQEIVQEIRELPQMKVGIKYGLTEDGVFRFIDELLDHATLITPIPDRFTHPIDPDDSMYVNLALAANAKLIVSNDNHLLDLNNPAKPWSQDFREQHRDIQILTPANYLQECRARELRQRRNRG